LSRYGLSEDELVDLIMLSGYQLQLRDGDVDHRAVPITKFVHSVAEDLGLDDVTRCWYLYGNYTLHPHASEAFLLHLMRRQVIPEAPTANDLVKLSKSRKAAGIFAKIRKTAMKYGNYFKGDTVNLRRHIYKNRAPEQYRMLYIAHLDYTVVCDEVLKKYRYAPLDRKVEKNFSKQVFALQQAVYTTDLRESCRDVVSEYATLMEAMVIARCAKVKRTEAWYDEWEYEFKTLVSEYDDAIWRYPASQIADETLIGPRGDDFRHNVRAYIDTVENFMCRALPEKELHLSSLGLLPSIVDIEDSTGVSELKAEEREDIKEAFYIYLK
jgi:hypothetical protein